MILHSPLSKIPFYHLVERTQRDGPLHKWKIQAVSDYKPGSDAPKSEVFAQNDNGIRYETTYTKLDAHITEIYANRTKKGKYRVTKVDFVVQDGSVFTQDIQIAKAKKLKRAIEKAKYPA